MNWIELKKKGNQHYKRGMDLVEPIDLYKDGQMLRDFALASIIKYAYRNRSATLKPMNDGDLEKIIHYAEMLMVINHEQSKEQTQTGEEETKEATS